MYLALSCGTNISVSFMSLRKREELKEFGLDFFPYGPSCPLSSSAAKVGHRGKSCQIWWPLGTPVLVQPLTCGLGNKDGPICPFWARSLGRALPPLGFPLTASIHWHFTGKPGLCIGSFGVSCSYGGYRLFLG